MKIFITVCILLLASICFAVPVELSWDANSEPPCPNLINEDVCISFYRVHSTFVPGFYSETYPYTFPDVPVGTEHIIFDVDEEDYELLYFSITAHGECYDEVNGTWYDCKSGYSNEVNVLDEPSDSGSITITGSGSSGGGCFINSTR